MSGLPLEAINETTQEDGNSTNETRKRKGTTRARVTETNARLIAHIGKYPAATTEALSILNYTQRGPFAEAGKLPSERSIVNVMRKLEKLEAVQRFRHAATGVSHYGLTPIGYEYARTFGYDFAKEVYLKGMSLERLTHYAMISHVAAQFASPAGFFEETLRIKPIAAEMLISENEMRAAFAPVKDHLAKNKKEGKESDYARYRAEEMRAAVNSINAGKLPWSEFVTSNPLFLTIGQPQREGSSLKAVHQPDLAVLLDGDREAQGANNVLVEVELSKKNWDAYDSILATVAAELSRPFVYKRAVYFVMGNQVANLIKKVNAAGEYNLIETGRLTIIPITHRDGSPMTISSRIGGI